MISSLTRNTQSWQRKRWESDRSSSPLHCEATPELHVHENLDDLLKCKLFCIIHNDWVYWLRTVMRQHKPYQLGSKPMCFPDGSVVKKKKKKKSLPINAGEARNVSTIPILGRFFWNRRGKLTPIFLPGKCHRQRFLKGYSSRKELNMVEQLNTHRHTTLFAFQIFYIEVLIIQSLAVTSKWITFFCWICWSLRYLPIFHLYWQQLFSKHYNACWFWGNSRFIHTSSSSPTTQTPATIHLKICKWVLSLSRLPFHKMQRLTDSTVFCKTAHVASVSHALISRLYNYSRELWHENSELSLSDAGMSEQMWG